ncbi:hypothetical protein [uncultured Tenacibaculum sp.]|uniref:hypothetical protein n=1 Tax=uncultured Tenacibaculum sp. TaxID=174713 RepID=UPI002614DAD8|nr:hypothetical protein [uncultured Tenacibaculum sp.]
MKKLVVLVVVMLLSASSFAVNENPAKNEIRSKIVELLGKTSFTVSKDVKTSVEFLINKNGEIVILDIDCKNEQVCGYVKSKLNYKKISSELIIKNKVYRMPLVVKAK